MAKNMTKHKSYVCVKSLSDYFVEKFLPSFTKYLIDNFSDDKIKLEGHDNIKETTFKKINYKKENNGENKKIEVIIRENGKEFINTIEIEKCYINTDNNEKIKLKITGKREFFDLLKDYFANLKLNTHSDIESVLHYEISFSHN